MLFYAMLKYHPSQFLSLYHDATTSKVCTLLHCIRLTIGFQIPPIESKNLDFILVNQNYCYLGYDVLTPSYSQKIYEYLRVWIARSSKKNFQKPIYILLSKNSEHICFHFRPIRIRFYEQQSIRW